jgi:hypothetical protein
MLYKRLIVLVLALATSALCAKKDRDWKTGKVLDSQLAKTRAGIAATAETTPTIRDTQLMIVGKEFAYVIEDSRVSGSTSLIGLTARTISNRHHGCRFIVGDDIKYYQQKAVLHILDTDGKECKAEVLRQERLQVK